MTDDLISRQAAIDAINSHFGFNIEEEYGIAEWLKQEERS